MPQKGGVGYKTRFEKGIFFPSFHKGEKKKKKKEEKKKKRKEEGRKDLYKRKLSAIRWIFFLKGKKGGRKERGKKKQRSQCARRSLNFNLAGPGQCKGEGKKGKEKKKSKPWTPAIFNRLQGL